MAVYKVFTWNMQRGQSVSWKDAKKEPDRLKERYRVLKALVDWADFGFITEPGMDIRNGLDAYSNLSNPDGWYYVSGLDDNQNQASACRPVVYSKLGFSRVPNPGERYVRFSSGADTAHRYPALGIVKLPYNDGQGNNELLLVSFHATSGFGATQNCEGYFDEFYQNQVIGNQARAIPLLWIVGGDFNCNPRQGVYMPPTSTHQSDHTLDGFFADQNGTNFKVTLTTGPHTYLRDNGGKGQLITDTYVDPHGYVVSGHHLSDHCPVTAQLQIARRLSDDKNLDQDNILPQGTKSTRSKSQRYDPSGKVPRTKY